MAAPLISSNEVVGAAPPVAEIWNVTVEVAASVKL